MGAIRLAFGALCFLLVGALGSNNLGRAASSDSKEYFNWTSLQLYDHLVYTDCYDGYKCAKLRLPLDWLDLSNKNNVSIAITMFPAVVEPTDPSFGGTVILNPGGPANSGVSFIRRAGRAVQKIVDGKKHFNVLSFDPRGVSFSEPNAHCFANNEKLDLWDAKKSAIGHLDDNPNALSIKLAASQAQGMLCASPEVSGFTNGDNIRSFMSTASVARDVVAIAEKMDDLRLQAGSPTPGQRNHGSQEGAQVTMSTGKTGTLVQYWGFSYGTILGNTIASLYPDKIGRMILDGVADAPDYVVTGWSKNLQDTEKVMAHFFELCFSGASHCPLYRSTDHQPNDIRKRFETVLSRLKQSPIPIAEDGNARLITYSDLKDEIVATLYRPYTKFPTLATAVNEMIHGNYTPMLEAVSRRSLISIDESDSYNIPFPPDSYEFQYQVHVAILCGDGADLTNSTLEEFKQYYDLLQEQSPTVGPHWSEVRLSCMGWPSSLRPKWRFPGPFVTRDRNATAHPILVIGNTMDPVTPLRNAFAASERHERSGVLTQDSAGHCSLFPTSNACTAAHVRAYFNDGVLPPPGTVCSDECVPWTRKTCNVDSTI